ncbi:unnamed protein product [Cyclocybe aegerita]|uniref:DUF6593 domain-containing protein n=1 Tax=Cyclocybe aegerita TaxID=1973307 RepID=A0A8S0XFE2_CYCAE|nr:unnamed protein product [Cyclocybe aegerita]
MRKRRTRDRHERPSTGVLRVHLEHLTMHAVPEKLASFKGYYMYLKGSLRGRDHPARPPPSPLSSHCALPRTPNLFVAFGPLFCVYVEMASSRSSLSSSSTCWGPYDLDSHVPENTENTEEQAFASTSTLVNDAPSLSLVFDRNSVINATLYSRAGPMYKITTNKNVTRTDLCDLAEQRVVATVKRREIFPDVVVFAHRRGKSVRISKWLKATKVPGSRPTASIETETGRFTWRSDETHRLALYPEDETEFPIAYLRTVLEPPTIGLMINASTDTMRIETITSFLILEHRLRMQEKQREAHLYGLSGPFVVMG